MRMKAQRGFMVLKAILAMLGMFVIQIIQAQNFPELQLELATDKTEAKVGDIITISLKGTVPKDFYVYSSNIKCEIGPLPPSVEIRNTAVFEAIGGFESVGDKTEIDDVFECQVGKFTKKVYLKHKFKVLKPGSSSVLKFELQMCSNVSGVCLPVKIKKNLQIGLANETQPFVEKIQLPANTANALSQNNGAEIIPIDTLVSDIDLATKTAKVSNNKNELSGKFSPIGDFRNNKDYILKNPADEGKCNELHKKEFNGISILDDFNKGGLLGLFVLAFLAGLAALITPCVFPMIPMTVTYFLKQNKTRSKAIMSALFFGLCIIVVYQILGLVFAVAFGPKVVNYIATAAVPNIIFFLIFLLFAFSFFGAFEITLPASLTTNLDQKADKGGYLGIFFMALTLAVVSFSCTGPIVATVLVQSADGELIKPLLAMGGFALAFALPFTLAAIFPSLLNAMPKSGGWLNAVKVCLGFVEIAFGLKFLSIADQTYHWGILDREIYLAIWIALFTLMGFYLMGKIKFSHDSELKSVSVPRLMCIIVTFTFVIYLIPGMWGAPLKGLSGYLPPMGTQDFNLIKYGVGGNVTEEPIYGDKLEIPLGLEGYFDYDQALRVAAELKKPLFLDFTGHGCVNCRKMEESVWDDEGILKKLRNDYVVVSLYVDDKKIKLPPSEYFVAMSDGDSVKTLGDKNSAIQQCLYGVLAQPQYVLIDYNQNLLAKPVYSDFEEGNKERFLKFLQDGDNYFKAKLALE